MHFFLFLQAILSSQRRIVCSIQMVLNETHPKLAFMQVTSISQWSILLPSSKQPRFVLYITLFTLVSSPFALCQLIPHEKYDGVTSHGFDIAVIRLETSIDFKGTNANVKCVCNSKPMSEYVSLGSRALGCHDAATRRLCLLERPSLTEEQCYSRRVLCRWLGRPATKILSRHEVA